MEKTSFEEFITQKMKLDEELYKLEEKIAALRAHAEKSTTSLTLAPGGNAFDDSRLEDLVIKISDLEAKEKKIRKEMEGVSAQLSSFLVELDSTDQMKILMMRYVDLMEFDAIARRLPYTPRSMYRYHKEGLARAKALYQERNRPLSG